MTKLTWKELVKLEPRLKKLEERIKLVRDPKDTEWFCANRIWYDKFKEDVCSLVGFDIWRGADPRLTTSEAYDLAYRHLYELLPPCRNCTCF